MSRADEHLYGLMEIAERQQAAVQTALEGLAAERAALAREREQLAQARQALELGARAAVRSAVEDSMARAAGMGVEAVQAAAVPLLGRLDRVADGAGQAEAALRRVVLWASWRLLGWGVAGIAALAVLWWLASSAVLWWDAGAIGSAQVQKAQLEAEIAQLLATRDGWRKAGMLGKLEQCGADRRPCIRVDESAGQFEADGHSDYRVIQRY
ncbi:hypothetical protein [Lichenicoccus roseus]|uniref:Uncharacterized protein n=1 Tax=Lichenicoccus roseus TaxID=2683649 RepID=A0A5R9J1E0_9PROT|nr:hypothetical protein [Lichenicoccus roseus]TLU70663.1 hypothetical protein FE263_20970 [Lichenicoccus roseus]